MVKIKEEITKIIPNIEAEKLEDILVLFWKYANEYANYESNQAVNSAINSLSRFN